MPISLVQHLRLVIAQTRQANRGLFAAEDISKNKAAIVSDLVTLQSFVMWPKLFRRLAAYFFQGHTNLDQFDECIRQDPIGRDDSLRLPDGEKGNMHDAYVISGNSLSLTFDPEELLIAPDPAPVAP